MPNRIVRDGINDSKAISSLSDSGEILYRRLMSIVDDYGRYEADADLIRARCFPRCLERWPVQRVYDALQETNLTIGSDGLPLVILYTNGSKTYLQINNFGQRVRTESKFPAPTARDVVRHPLTNVSGTPTAVAHARARSESESETYAETESSSEAETPRRPLLVPQLPATPDQKTDDDIPLYDVRRMLHTYTQRFPIRWGPPDDDICRRTLSAAGGSIEELGRRLMDLGRKEARPRDTYGWFPVAVKNTA